MIVRENSIKIFDILYNKRSKSMPNLKGGKKYKAGKHSDTKAEFHEIEDGQMVARVIKHLGDRNIRVYCNDGKERIAHIRGGLSKKKACIDVGDIVLISLRTNELNTESSKQDRGDVLAKYEKEVLGQLKKMENVNKHLFLQLETIDRTKIQASIAGAVDEGFEFEEMEQVNESENSEEFDKDELAKKHKINEIKRANERDIKHTSHVEDDVDIDAI